MFLSSKNRHQDGQIGVVVLLIMSVVLTLGLSAAANSVRDLAISQSEEETSRVFNAAEAGIEEALSGSLNEGAGILESINNVDVNYDIVELNRVETIIFEGSPVEVDVTGVSDGQELVIDWSREDNCLTEEPASLLVGIFSDDGGIVRSRYEVLGSCDRSDGFELASNIDQDGYHRRSTVTLTSDDFLVRVKPVYNDTHLRVTGNGWVLPLQGHLIRSQASSQIGNETRVVEVNRTLPVAPSIFDNAVASGDTIIK